ncbi:MAG: hypothetical protein KBC81_00685 [Candidatus Pacebacteria bacterium]|nr:hypothetical protein [Candidatus Paceibacterota bacterium]
MDYILLFVYALLILSPILYVYVGRDIWNFYKKSYWKQFTLEKFVYTLIAFALVQWVLNGILY